MHGLKLAAVKAPPMVMLAVLMALMAKACAGEGTGIGTGPRAAPPESIPAAPATAPSWGPTLDGPSVSASTQAAPRDVTPARDAQAYARLPVCKLSADGKRLAIEPCRTAPAPTPMPRRAVTQLIDPMPSSRLAPQVAMPAAPPSPSLESLLHPPGAPIPVGCGAGGCYDGAGTLHNNAAPGTALSPSGKLCNRSGAWLQC